MHKAAERCAANHARLAVINVWSAPRFVFFVALAGQNPILHGAGLEHDASEWLRRVVSDLDPELAVSFASRNEPPDVAISREILAAPYDELVVSERLARREFPRIRHRLEALGVKLLVAVPSASMSNHPRLPLARPAQPVQP